MWFPAVWTQLHAVNTAFAQYVLIARNGAYLGIKRILITDLTHPYGFPDS